VESWGGGVVADLGMRTLEVNRNLFHIRALQESALLLITESSIPYNIGLTDAIFGNQS
jgi:hypothetical protein